MGSDDSCEVVADNLTSNRTRKEKTMQKLTEAEALSLIEVIIPHVTCGEAKKAIERLKEAGVIKTKTDE